jgi:hypothetical protein
MIDPPGIDKPALGFWRCVRILPLVGSGTPRPSIWQVPW